MIYLDNAAAGRPHPELGHWYSALVGEYYVNPHGGTCYSEHCRRLYLEAGRRLLELLGIPPSEARVIFTSGVTEALTLGMNGYHRFIVDGGSHGAVLSCAQGEVLPLGAPADGVDSLVCLNLVNNETGAIADVMACRNMYPAATFLVDGAQALAKVSIPWHQGIDMLALSSRKIGGPAAVGALVVRKACDIHPLIPGGGQQNGLRGGTVDVVGVSLFVRVLEARMKTMQHSIEKVKELNQLLWQQLNAVEEVQRISPENGSPYIAMFSLPGYEGAVVVRSLAQNWGIQVSSASACSAETNVLSPTLTHLGYSEEVIRGAIRVSFSSDNTPEEIRAFCQALQAVKKTY